MQKEPIWPKIRAYVLWFVSAAIGLFAFFAAYETVHVLVPMFVVPWDPMHTTEYQGQSWVIQIITLFGLGIIWVAWYIALIEMYPKAKNVQVLMRRFGITTAIQAAILVLYYVAHQLLLGS